MTTRLVSMLLEALDAELKPKRFKLIQAKKWFVRQLNGRSEKFQIMVSFGRLISASAGIRFEEVETIYHRTSGFESQNQKGTSTLATDVTQDRQLLLNDESDVPAITTQLLELFHSIAEPFFARFKGLGEVDSALNENPKQRCRYSAPHFRFSKGIIVAKLVGRKNIDKLLIIYREQAQRLDEGCHLPEFEALVKDLRNG